MTGAFDAIVVGARCAGSPTAMLLLPVVLLYSVLTPIAVLLLPEAFCRRALAPMPVL